MFVRLLEQSLAHSKPYISVHYYNYPWFLDFGLQKPIKEELSQSIRDCLYFLLFPNKNILKNPKHKQDFIGKKYIF